MASTKEAKDKKKLSNQSDLVRQCLTKEMTIELMETFNSVADASGKFSWQKLPLVLKALGMNINESNEASGGFLQEDITLDKFLQIVTDCMKHPNWAANEMNESFHLFDKGSNGFIEPPELKRVFNKIGEKLSETELQDQLREFDIDGDLQVSLIL
jgi:calmodulin